VPLIVLLLLLFVVAVILGSMYLLLLAKTVKGIGDNPYLFAPLLVLEVALALVVAYLAVVYTNRVRKYILKSWR